MRGGRRQEGLWRNRRAGGEEEEVKKKETGRSQWSTKRRKYILK